MTHITIITPWAGATAHLMPDYAIATQGTWRVLIDNASDDATHAALMDLPDDQGGIVVNARNAGFAPANNQGYDVAPRDTDIIIFLNSDIAGSPAWLRAVAADVRDGALYGPALAQQLVAGRWLPYLEGWCIAATRRTWDRLTGNNNDGPWDAYAYPGPYWEDNDLCLRALAADISLVQTAWPIQHKGGQTAGGIVNHAASFEANRHFFAQRADVILGPPPPKTPMRPAYLTQCGTQSDIQHHLPLLYSYARGTVVELGTRSGVSTAAFLAGVEAHGGHVWSVDTDPRSAQVAAGHTQWTFSQGSSIDAATRTTLPHPIDVLLIDTIHTFRQVEAELALWADAVAPGGVILLHDPETFPGVRRAIEAFCARTNWPVTFVLPCNGMAVITKPQPLNVSAEGAAWAAEVAA